jgi:hypothetical protein
MQRQRKHTSMTIEELLGWGVLNVFSMRGPSRRFIGDNEGRLQAFVEREAEWREASAFKINVWAVIIDCNCEEPLYY